MDETGSVFQKQIVNCVVIAVVCGTIVLGVSSCSSSEQGAVGPSRDDISAIGGDAAKVQHLLESLGAQCRATPETSTVSADLEMLTHSEASDSAGKAVEVLRNLPGGAETRGIACQPDTLKGPAGVALTAAITTYVGPRGRRALFVVTGQGFEHRQEVEATGTPAVIDPGIDHFAAGAQTTDPVRQKCVTAGRTLRTAVQAFQLENGSYPQSEDELVASGVLDGPVEGWNYQLATGAGTFTVNPVPPCS